MIGEFLIIKRKIINSFDKIFSKNDTIIDVGCGNNPYYHKKIKGKIICSDIIKTKRGHIICDASSLPLKKSKSGGIVCVNSLYYYKNPFEAINEFSHALKKRGKLVIITPFMYPIHDIPQDKYRFTEYGIKEILKNDFNIKKIKPIGGIFNLPAVFFHSLIKGIPLAFPKAIRPIIKFLVVVILYIPYILAQVVSLLDFLDITRRWPTYYFTIAIKK